MKYFLALILTIYLVPILAFVAIHLFEGAKAWAKIKWWTVIYPLGVFGLSAFAIFPIAWYTRNIPILKHIFWIWMDDTRFVKVKEGKVYAQDYGVYMDWKPETFKKAYAWHTRNRCWNLDTLFRPRKRGARVIIQNVTNKLFMNDKLVNQAWPWIPMGRLKYWKWMNGKLVEGPQVNSGVKISKRQSIFGVGYVWEKIGDRLTFRYSFCLEFLWWYLNFVSGEGADRYVFSFKIKRKIEIL